MVETSFIKIKVLFFATLKEKAGCKECSLSIPVNSTVENVKSILIERFPELNQSMQSVVVAVNHEFSFEQELIPENAEVALFPPVSGGSGFPTILLVTEEEIDINRLLSQITLPATGAACFFTGMVRGITQRDSPHETTYLVYEAYQPMAEVKMQQVADEIRNRWPLIQGIAIVQRIGQLFPTSPTVLIACSSAHRDDGIFAASHYGIDRLKEIVPIWKKEFSPTGETWVEGDYFPGDKDK